MNELLEKHERIGQILDGYFRANEEPMLDWAEIGFALKKIPAMQAKIDRLMIEYCPEEMTGDQYANWGLHQTPVDDDVIVDFKEKTYMFSKKANLCCSVDENDPYLYHVHNGAWDGRRNGDSFYIIETKKTVTIDDWEEVTGEFVGDEYYI